MTNKTCPFCALPAERILLSNLHGLVIRDAFPVSPGHILVIPRRHVGSIFKIEPLERDALLALLEEAKRRLERDMKPDGYNIGINDGPTAGQTVPHLHIHLIRAIRRPRGPAWRRALDHPGKSRLLGRMKPSAEQQLQFLQHLQRLFDEGDFVATYKYALLMSLAELAVESGGGDGEGELHLPMVRIAEKFAELYWPQTVPYASGVAGTNPSVLAQNQGTQAAVVNYLSILRAQGAATIAHARQLPGWNGALRTIASTVANMPLRYLQNVGGVLVPSSTTFLPHAARWCSRPASAPC